MSMLSQLAGSVPAEQLRATQALEAGVPSPTWFLPLVFAARGPGEENLPYGVCFESAGRTSLLTAFGLTSL